MSIFKEKQAILSCIGVIGFILLLNLNTLFTFGYDEHDANGTYIDTVCWGLAGVPDTYWMNTWDLVHSFLYSYVPFILLFISNFLLIHTIRTQRRVNLSERQIKKQRSMTITIVSITFLFILLTGTGAVVNFFIVELESTYTGYVIMSIGDLLCFSFHALNIISLLVTNKRFRLEFNSLLRFQEATDVESTTKQSALNTTSKH